VGCLKAKSANPFGNILVPKNENDGSRRVKYWFPLWFPMGMVAPSLSLFKAAVDEILCRFPRCTVGVFKAFDICKIFRE
jgi:hypothetical protein